LWEAQLNDDFLQKYPNLEEFLPFLDLLKSESARGKVLISSGFLEEQLRRVLLAFMREDGASNALVDGANAPLGTFSARIAACDALGLLSESEAHDLQIIRKIRNDFAHDIHTSFETTSVKDRCKMLKMKAHDYSNERMGEVVVSADGQFITAATAVILNLVNRPHYVSQKRRTPETWPY